MSSNRVTTKGSLATLSPTVEESAMFPLNSQLLGPEPGDLVTGIPSVSAIDIVAAMQEPHQYPAISSARQSKTAVELGADDIFQDGPPAKDGREHRNTKSSKGSSFSFVSRIAKLSQDVTKLGDHGWPSSAREGQDHVTGSFGERTEREIRASELDPSNSAGSEQKALTLGKTTIKHISRGTWASGKRVARSNHAQRKSLISRAKSLNSLGDEHTGHDSAGHAGSSPRKSMDSVREDRSGSKTRSQDALVATENATARFVHPFSTENQVLADSTKLVLTPNNSGMGMERAKLERTSNILPVQNQGHEYRTEDANTSREELAWKDPPCISTRPSVSTMKSSADSTPHQEVQLPYGVGSGKVDSKGGRPEQREFQDRSCQSLTSSQETALRYYLGAVEPEVSSVGAKTRGRTKPEGGGGSPREEKWLRKSETEGLLFRGIRIVQDVVSAVSLPEQDCFNRHRSHSPTPGGKAGTPVQVVGSPKTLGSISGVSIAHPDGAKAAGRGVKAMAALFEHSNKDSASVPTPTRHFRSTGDLKSAGVVSGYTMNGSPSRRETWSSREVPSDPMESPKGTSIAASLKSVDDSRLPRDMHRPKSQEKVELPTTSKLAEDIGYGQVMVASGADSGVGGAQPSPRGRAREKDRTSNRSEKFAGVILKHRDQSRTREELPPRTAVMDQERDIIPPSLGRMTPHQEEPEVARHINFSRPPSSTMLRKDTPSLEALSDMQANASPGPSGSTSVLHAQIRNLQRQLDARNEAVKQLRRQLETKANLDLGTLSEQLRQSKRECRMWRERAEAAERRVAVFERFTAKIRKLKERGNEEEGGTMLPITARIVKVPEEENPCLELMEVCARRTSHRSSSTHTEDEVFVRERIRKSFQVMDGGASSSHELGSDQEDGEGGESESEEEENREEEEKEKGKKKGWLGTGELPSAAVSVWMATQELLEHEDMRSWLAKP